MFSERETIRISEASKALAVAPSTASRLMSMLQYHGFVEQDPQTKAYRSGPRLAEIAYTALRRQDGRFNVHPHLERVAAEVNETVHFLVLSGGEIRFLDGVESTKPVRTTLRLGVRIPAHCVSGGKAILATLPRNQVHEIYPQSRLRQCTPKSIATRKALDAELDRVREQGYATSIEESEPDIAAVAVAVADWRGRTIGAFSISMPASRFESKRVPELLVPLGRAVRAVREG